MVIITNKDSLKALNLKFSGIGDARVKRITLLHRSDIKLVSADVFIRLKNIQIKHDNRKKGIIRDSEMQINQQFFPRKV